MKPETGNNLSAPKNDVSIQLKLGGHSFSTASLPPETANADTITFVVETHKVTLVPKRAFDESSAGDYLSAVGLPCAEDETPVCSEMQADTIAVMAISRTALSEIIAAFGVRAKFTSPLLCSDHDGKRNISIRITDGVAYYRAFDNGLQAAEAIKTVSDDDILYYTVRIAEALDFGKESVIYIKGGKSAAKLVKRYFKNVICE